MTDDRHPYITGIVCSYCGTRLKIRVTCGDRTCPTCRKKWFGYHYKSILNHLAPWPMVHILTLTYKNISDREFGPSWVKKIRSDFTKFRKTFKEIQGGFYVVQTTNKGNGWHLHLHVLYDGFFIAQKKASKRWLEITHNSFMVHLRVAQDPKVALRYLLADFSGAPRIRLEDYEEYNRTFHGSRLVQPFGKYRNIKLRAPYPCPHCGRIEWIPLDVLLGEKRGFHREWDKDPP